MPTPSFCFSTSTLVIQYSRKSKPYTFSCLFSINVVSCFLLFDSDWLAFWRMSYHLTTWINVIGYKTSINILIGYSLDSIVPLDHPIIVKEPIVYSLSLVVGMWSLTAFGFVLALIFLFINIKYSNVK